MKVVFALLATVASLALPAEAKQSAKVRTPAALEEGKCYANIGIVGTLKGVIREPHESETILYLKDCLKFSSSDAIFEIPSTLPGVVPRHFIAKVKANEVPFVFGLGSFQYHLLNGVVIGVTRLGN
jgi:hypothetical protein